MAHAVDQGNSKQPRFSSAYPWDGSVGPRASEETDSYCASAANLPVTDCSCSWCRPWWSNSSGMSAKRSVAPSESSVKFMAPGYWSSVATSLRQTHAPSSPCNLPPSFQTNPYQHHDPEAPTSQEHRPSPCTKATTHVIIAPVSTPTNNTTPFSLECIPVYPKRPQTVC